VAALTHAIEDLVVVLACDTPLIDAGVIRTLVAAATREAPTPLAGSIAVAAGRPQPLIAAYSRDALPVLRAVLDAPAAHPGDRAVHRALSNLPLVQVEIDADLALNVNVPADLAAAAERLSRSGRRSTSLEGGGR
jgi:molybdopterin-guanine dinucleotide biosynthesis protein A